MAKKKGGKADKAPKMDEAMSAEFKKQQQIAAKAELRQRMADEIKNSSVNGLKIMNQWRKIMRLAKVESLKKDIEILSQNHERDVDRKDAILQMLDRDLEESEDQYQMALRSHLINVDTLIKLHDSRLYSLEKAFQQELKTMQNDFHTEKDTLTLKFKQESKDLQSIIDVIEAEEDERENDARNTIEQLREEIRNRNLEDINMIRISLDAQIEELEQHFETAHLNYLQQTAQRTHDFKELTQNDQRLSQDIDHKRKALDALQTQIQYLRAKIRHLNRDSEDRNRLLLDEKHTIQRHYQQLKQRIQVYRSLQNQRLLELSQSANSCKEKLTNKLEIAKRVLQSTELSRKMETTEELVLPFAPFLNTADEGKEVDEKQQMKQQRLQKMESEVTEEDISITSGSVNKDSYTPLSHQSSVWSSSGNAIVPTDRLANYYRKHNKILLDNIAIDKERTRLQQENAQLEDLIKQFMDGTKLSDMTLDGDNPLFVVNGRANLNYNAPNNGVAHPTIQEAVMIQSTVARQGVRR